MYTEQCCKAYGKFQDILEEMLASQKHGAVLLVSIENMAAIIAVYNEKNVLQLVSQVHEIIKNTLNDLGINTDYIFFIQNDQFAVIIEGGKVELSNIANNIHGAVQKYYGISEDVPMHVSLSMGGVKFPSQAENVSEVMNKAYIALKSASKNINQYFCDIDNSEFSKEDVLNKMEKAYQIKKAMDSNNVKLAFQPIISSKDGGVLCYEALLRLVSEDGELISAGPFIGIAEEMDFISDIDFAVFKMVYKELVSASDIMLSFNVSNQTVDCDMWLHEVEKILKDKEAIASRMIVEITETGIQRNINHATDFVIRLQSLGCQVALDDFGAGYTSFRQLSRLPIDIVKIDGSFIKNMLNNNESHNFVRTLLDFTNSCGLKTVAEFVETGEITKELMELNVDYLQGHYFGKPAHVRPWQRKG